METTGVDSVYHSKYEQFRTLLSVIMRCPYLILCIQRELADRLLPCFNSPTHIPYSDINLHTGSAHPPKWGPDSSVAEVSSIQLEFRDLTHITGDRKYQDAVDRALEKLQADLAEAQSQLVPMFINAHTGRLHWGTITVGARSDSYYEYLLKQWLQSGKKEEK